MPEVKAENCNLLRGLEHLIQRLLNLPSLFAEWELPLLLLHLSFREIKGTDAMTGARLPPTTASQDLSGSAFFCTWFVVSRSIDQVNPG